MLVTLTVFTIAASHPVDSPARSVMSAATDLTRNWVAQTEEEEDQEKARPTRRRLLDREGLKNVVRNPAAMRQKIEAQRKAAEATSDQGSGGRTDTAAPPPAATRAPSAGRTPGGASATGARSGTPPGGAAGARAGGRGSSSELDFKERARKGKFSFEFSKAEIVDIVKAISDMTRRNFIIPEKLKSQRITILSPSKITAREAYQVFLAALAVNGITVVRSGRFYKLMESKAAIKTPIPTCVTPEDECPEFSEIMITTLVLLKYIEAQQINAVVKSLVSKEGELTIFTPSNALIISEYAPNLERLKRIINALDQPGFDDELQIVQIKFAGAQEIADKLTQIFDVQARGRAGASGKPPASAARKRAADKAAAAGGGGEGDDVVQISKIVPDDRTNQIIIKANRRSFPAIQQLIDKLDVPITEEEQGRVHVYYLENADAEDLASTLSSLAQGQARRPQAQRGGAAANQQNRAPDSAVLFEGEVKITADKSTNALIVMASAHDFRALRNLINKLDTPRRQVFVEAAILEVVVTDQDEFGVNWHAPMRFSRNDIGQDVGPAVGFIQSSQASGGVSPTLGAMIDPTALLGLAGGSLGGILGRGINLNIGSGDPITVPSFGIILRWLQSSSKANILSTPHILTTDNEEASIEVGQKIPFLRGTSLPAGIGAAAGAAGLGGANQLAGLGSLFSSTDRIDVSLKLNIKPQINERDKIKLEIDQQIEDLVGREEQTRQPITANRNAKTVVVVDDQQTVVIGGLMRDRTRDSESKIPILGDLPIIGWLFKQRSTEIEKVNLLLVLTPYIIKEKDDFQRIFERKMREHEEFAADFYGSYAEYRAHIDYNRRTGPLARLAATIKRERMKVENGGTGGEDELIITPSPEPEAAPEEGDSLIVDDPVGEDPAGEDPVVDDPVEEPAAEGLVAPPGGEGGP